MSSCSSSKKLSTYSTSGKRLKCLGARKTRCANTKIYDRCDQCPSSGGGIVNLDQATCALPLAECPEGWPNILPEEKYYAVVVKGDGADCRTQRIEFPCAQLSQLFLPTGCNLNFNFKQKVGVGFPPTTNTTLSDPNDPSGRPLEDHLIFHNLLASYNIDIPNGPNDRPRPLRDEACFSDDGLYMPIVDGNYLINVRVALNKDTNSGTYGIFVVEVAAGTNFVSVLRYTIGQPPNSKEVPATLDLTTILRLSKDNLYAIGFAHNKGQAVYDFSQFQNCVGFPPSGEIPLTAFDPVSLFNGTPQQWTALDVCTQGGIPVFCSDFASNPEFCDGTDVVRSWPRLDEQSRSWISITRIPDFDGIGLQT